MNQPSLALSPDRLVLSLPYEAREAAKRIPGYRWDRGAKSWSYPRSYVALEAILRVFDGTLNIHPDVKPILSSWKLQEEYLEEVRQGEHLEAAPAHLYRHQKIALQIAKASPRHALYLDTGLGKTCLSIEIIRHYGGKWLVVCPLSIIEAAWMEDVRKFASAMRTISLWDNSRSKRMAALSKDADIYIVNYEGFKLLLPEIEKKEWQGLIVDEASKIKSTGSAITKAITAFAKTVPNVYLLSGTPAPNNPVEFYPQMKIIDEGLFGTKTGTVNRYFDKVGYGGYTLRLKPEMAKDYMARIKTRAIFFSKDQCLDLPEQTFITRHVQMTPEQKRCYDKMLQDCIIEWKSGGDSRAVNALAKILKLREITSGFCYKEDGSTQWITKQKFDELDAVLEELGDKQVIVLCQFIEEIEELKRRLKGEAVYIYGETAQVDKEEGVRRFKEGGVRLMVGHPRSMAHGLTLTNASYICWLAQDWSLENWLQANARVHRIGQRSATIVISLVCPQTIDSEILGAVKRKQKVSDHLLEMINGH